jgi:hypothetical protein
VSGAQVARAGVIRANDECVTVFHTCWSCDQQVRKEVVPTVSRSELPWYCERCDVGWVGPGAVLGGDSAA